MNIVAIVLFVIWFNQIGIYMLYSSCCSYPEQHNGLKVMILSDIHLLGFRRRTLLERYWVDWHAFISYYINSWFHPPDVLILLGDQFDEGSPPTTQQAWDEYKLRFYSIFQESTVPIIYLMGNHDAEFGQRMTRSMMKRHEATFGPSNQVYHIQNETFIALNTMVLVDDVRDPVLRNETLQFLHSVASLPQPKYLLIHMPLYRPNDLECGAARRQEAGHVTYEAPNFPYHIGHHVLSPNATKTILDSIQPNYIFSGHTHAQCFYNHTTTLQEATIPTYSWGMRPDPSFGLARVYQGKVQVRICSLPYETYIFGIYLVTVAWIMVRLTVQQIFQKKSHTS